MSFEYKDELGKEQCVHCNEPAWRCKEHEGKPRCDWCGSYECKDTGGKDWGKYPIFACKCGHEFVVVARKK